MNYFEKNIEVLKESFPYIVDLISEYQACEEGEENHVYWDEDLDGNEILAVEKEGYLWYLNSRYHSADLVEKWCERHRRKNYFEPELVFGLANGDYLRKQRELNPENPIIVYEPDIQVFLQLIEQRDMSEVFGNDKFYLAIGKEGITQITVWMSGVINYSNYVYTDFCALPGYTSVYPYEYLLYKRAFMEQLESMILKKNTLSQLGKSAVLNEFSHLRDVVRQHTLHGLISTFQSKKEEIPNTAFLISAGPSLDKNIEDLKLIQGRGFIMAVDTAMKPLLQAGIKPDIFVTIDPAKDSFLFEQEGIDEVPLILTNSVQKTVSKTHTGKHFYMIGGNNYVLKYMKQYDKKCSSGSSGGSVATDAFSLLERMGFTTIVLVGQDLAYPNNRSHAKAAYDDEVNPNEPGKVFFMVEDIHGNEVLTRMDMNFYRRWFEKEIYSKKELHVIDATEGGARIHGTEIMTLKEAIEQQCEEVYDFAELIADVEPTFSEEEQKEILADIEKFPEYVKETVKKLEEGRRNYERLDKLNRQRKYQSSEFKRTYEEITDFNEWLNKDEIVEQLSSLSHREEFEVQSAAYSVKEDVYEDIREIAKHGISLIDTYLNKVKTLEECAKAMLPEE